MGSEKAVKMIREYFSPSKRDRMFSFEKMIVMIMLFIFLKVSHGEQLKLFSLTLASKIQNNGLILQKI